MTKERIQEVKERIMQDNGYLHIKRLPSKIASEVIEFLNQEEYGGNWTLGFCYIWNVFKETMPPKDYNVTSAIEGLQQQINELTEVMSMLNNRLPENKQTEDQGRLMADGSVRK